jgi:hypothetical protein
MIPAPRAFLGLTEVVALVELADFIVKQGNRTYIHYFTVVDDAQVQVLMGNRSRAALGISLDGLRPLPVGLGKSSDTPCDVNTASLFDVEAAWLSKTP